MQAAEVDLVNLIIKGSYVGVLLFFGLLAYKLFDKALDLTDKWADRLIVAFGDCTKAFGALTHAIESGRDASGRAPSPTPPPASVRGKDTKK
jgi:hypothetical protein